MLPLLEAPAFPRPWRARCNLAQVLGSNAGHRYQDSGTSTRQATEMPPERVVDVALACGVAASVSQRARQCRISHFALISQEPVDCDRRVHQPLVGVWVLYEHTP